MTGARPRPGAHKRRTVLVAPIDRARTEAVDMRRSLVERGAALVAHYSAEEIATVTDFPVRATSLQREEEAALRNRSEAGGRPDVAVT